MQKKANMQLDTISCKWKRDSFSLDGVWRFTPDPHADGEELCFWKPEF